MSGSVSFFGRPNAPLINLGPYPGAGRHGQPGVPGAGGIPLTESAGLGGSTP